MLLTKTILSNQYVQDIQQAKLKLAREPFGKVSAQTIANENRLQV